MPSASIEPSGGYDFVAFDNLAPKTSATDIVIYTAKSSGTAFASFDVTNSRLKVNRIAEYTGSNEIQFDDDIKFSQTSINIRGTTSDGSDTQRIWIGPGSVVGASRGGYLALYGNEHASTGQAELAGGNVSGSLVRIRNDGPYEIYFMTNGVDRWEIDGANGHFLPETNNTYDIGNSSFYIRNLYVAGNIQPSGAIRVVNQTLSGSAGAVSTYWTVTVNGSTYKIALLATS